MKLKKQNLKEVHLCVWIGMAILVFFVFVAVFAEQLMPYGMEALTAPFQRPSPEHLLGTNDIGPVSYTHLTLPTICSV